MKLSVSGEILPLSIANFVEFEKKEKWKKKVVFVNVNLKHNFDFSNPTILDKEQNLEKRLILEMIEILNNKNSINKRSDMDCFSNIY